MRFLASFFLWLELSIDLLMLALRLSLACLLRGAAYGPNHECMSLFLSPSRVKTFLSLSPSLVNTVVLTGLLRQASFAPSCRILEKTLALYERRVSLDAVMGLGFLFFLGFLLLSHDSGSESWVSYLNLVVMLFTNFLKPFWGQTSRIAIACLLTSFARCVPDYRIGWHLSLLWGHVSLSGAWVSGRASSYYPVGNGVVAVSVDVLPRFPMLCLLLFLVLSRVIICREMVHACGRITFLADISLPLDKHYTYGTVTHGCEPRLRLGRFWDHLVAEPGLVVYCLVRA
ncbi:hypothetical protein Tco_1311797 [Tanacetum coccineum]